MRIAVLATNRNPLVTPYAGGQEALTAALVQGFRRVGHEVVLYAAAGTPSDLADEVVEYPQLPRLSHVAALDPQVPEKPFLDDHHAFTFAVADLGARHDIDVIANHSLHHLPMSLSRTLEPPVVTTLHTPPFPWMELGAALAAPYARYVAVSQALAEQWTTLDSQVVLNGVDPEVFTYGPGGDRVIWAGRITPEKAPHLALEAARVAGHELVLAGPISDEQYFSEHIEPWLGSGASYLGGLEASELATALGSSAALLMTPMWEEPFGLVAAEAAMCGTPVVALDRGGVREVVTPETGVLVPARDLPREDVVRGLVAGLDVVESFDRHSVRAVAARSFGLDRCVKEHLSILKSAAQQGVS